MTGDALLGTAAIISESLTYRKIDYWCRRGLVEGQEMLVGSGHARLFTPEQVRRLRMLDRLTSAGIDLETAARVDAGAVLLGSVRLAFLGRGLTLMMADLS